MSAPPVRVPLAVDARFRVRVGPAVLPVRSVVLCAIVSPLAYALLSAGMPGLWGPGCAFFLLAVAAMCGSPERQGVWLGTHLLYQQAWRIMPNAIISSKPRRARVRALADGVRVMSDRPPLPALLRRIPRVARALDAVPHVVGNTPGLLHTEPGGQCAVLVVAGPPVSPGTDAYMGWCLRMVEWVSAQQCPAQLITTMAHHNSELVGRAFDARVAGWPATPLRALERRLSTGLSEQTIGLRHFLVLSPGSAGPDGVPHRTTPWRTARTRPVQEDEVRRVLQTATRTASAFAVDAAAADRDDIGLLLSGSALTCRSVFAGDGILHADGRYRVALTVTALPGSLDAGCVVDAMLRARAAGSVTLHLLPVTAAVAQRHLHQRSSMLRYAVERGADPVEAQVALQDAAETTAALAARELVPLRLALTVAIAHHQREETAAAAERFGAVLAGCGFRISEVTGPALLPLLATSAGGAPLRRSLILTTETVAARMLPCLGTPFGDITAPLLGITLSTGAPAHLSVWRQANHNAVILGSSGAGKSVAAKTLLVRHIMEGARAAVIDPDSEYGPLMRSVGGVYHELGDDSLNPLGCGAAVSADDAAGLVLPVLSVMAGDERGLADRRPIRRLADEDQGWLHMRLVDFFREARAGQPLREPLLRDLVAHLDARLADRNLTERERARATVITARLRRYTQGPRGRVFDRPSTFEIADRPVAVGMRRFAMSYGADLTPALAVLLTALLAEIERRRGPLLVVVDEAHRVTSDPDAGEVLGQLVRQARKHAAGVWMVSQRVDDFVRTDLGRTLAATASTKLILGAEEAAVADVASAFKLTDDETAAICPMQPGCGVVIAGGERATVRIVPGEAVLAVAGTTAAHLIGAAAAASLRR